eukprot:5643314-Prymnesium_polylepis.1
MHGRSGAAARARGENVGVSTVSKPSFGTRVSLSVSTFGGCSFALGVQHVSCGSERRPEVFRMSHRMRLVGRSDRTRQVRSVESGSERNNRTGVRRHTAHRPGSASDQCAAEQCSVTAELGSDQ